MDRFSAANVANWNERVVVHLRDSGAMYPIEAFRGGADALLPIEAAEIGDVSGNRLLHLQCHFGLDTLSLARRGAQVTGLDYSGAAVAAARRLAAETGFDATFVEGNVYDARTLLTGLFDIVYVTWGALNWLPDMAAWGRTVASLLAPGGRLYLAEIHPVLVQFEQEDDRLVVTWPRKTPAHEPIGLDSEETYAGDGTLIKARRTYEWVHPLSDIICGLTGAGLRVDFLHEHDGLPWRAVPMMEFGIDRMYRLPDGIIGPPLAFSLQARQAP